MTDRDLLVADLVRAILTEGPCSGSTLAQRVGARKADVLRLLHEYDIFERVGGGRYTGWRLVGTEREPQQSDETGEFVLGIIRRLQTLETRLDMLERRSGLVVPV
jgi:hypothetical protein